jgi:hypothetical protein
MHTTPKNKKIAKNKHHISTLKKRAKNTSPHNVPNANIQTFFNCMKNHHQNQMNKPKIFPLIYLNIILLLKFKNIPHKQNLTTIITTALIILKHIKFFLVTNIIWGSNLLLKSCFW